MNHYTLTSTLHSIWDKAVALYRNGNREPSSYFTEEEQRTLLQWGLEVMDIYDYAEDYTNGGDPDFGTFLLISSERVFYFHDVLYGKSTSSKINPDNLPPKTEKVDGIEWLPRILVKARGKLEGTLPDEIMYGCGGDRRFLRESGIHPAELLRAVRTLPDDSEVVRWVAERRKISV